MQVDFIMSSWGFVLWPILCLSKHKKIVFWRSVTVVSWKKEPCVHDLRGRDMATLQQYSRRLKKDTSLMLCLQPINCLGIGWKM